MIQGYADLLISAGEYAGRNDSAHMLPLFLGLAEEKLNRTLRVGAQEKVVTLPVVAGEATLPADFLEAREYCGPDSAPKRWMTVGNTLKSATQWSGDLTLTYYARLPALSPQNASNWLLEASPNTYLYALVEELATWGKDAELAGIAKQLKANALNDLTIADERARWGLARMEISGATP